MILFRLKSAIIYLIICLEQKDSILTFVYLFVNDIGKTKTTRLVWEGGGGFGTPYYSPPPRFNIPETIVSQYIENF